MTTLTSVEQEAVRRAEQLLDRSHYDETERVADARMCARHVLELAEMLETERSARVSIQERAEGLQSIIGKAAYEQVRGEA